MRRPATLKEMRDWSRSAPKNVPVFVYGRHDMEISKIEKHDVPALESAGQKVFMVPRKDIVLDDRDLKARSAYNRQLVRTFSGRMVVDLHTSPENASYYVKRFSRHIVGLEVPDREISASTARILVSELPKIKKVK